MRIERIRWLHTFLTRASRATSASLLPRTTSISPTSSLNRTVQLLGSPIGSSSNTHCGPGLRDVGWSGQIQNIDVDNISQQFDNSHFRPCAVMTQVQVSSAATRPNAASVQFPGQLALSIPLEHLSSIRVPVAGFSSTISGVRVLPGPGWTSNGSNNRSQSGTIYVYSRHAREVHVRISGLHGSSSPVTFSSLVDEFAPVATDASGTVRLEVRSGVTAIEFSGPAHAPSHSGITGLTVSQ